MTREEEIIQKAKEIALNWDDGRGNEFYHRVDMLCNMARWADEHPKNPWQDAKKNPPKVGQKVIGILDTGEIFDMEMTDDNIWFTDILTIDCPRFWMPIPETPKGGEK